MAEIRLFLAVLSIPTCLVSCQEIGNSTKCQHGTKRPADWPILLFPRRGRAREPCRATRQAGPGDRRARYRQGADRRTASPPLVALGRSVGGDELRRLARVPDRGRIVRP